MHLLEKNTFFRIHVKLNSRTPVSHAPAVAVTSDQVLFRKNKLHTVKYGEISPVTKRLFS